MSEEDDDLGEVNNLISLFNGLAKGHINPETFEYVPRIDADCAGEKEIWGGALRVAIRNHFERTNERCASEHDNFVVGYFCGNERLQGFQEDILDGFRGYLEARWTVHRGRYFRAIGLAAKIDTQSLNRLFVEYASLWQTYANFPVDDEGRWAQTDKRTDFYPFAKSDDNKTGEERK